MATRSQVIGRFAASTRLNPMTLERIMRALSDEGLVPKGGPGGRRRSAHFLAEHLAVSIAALAASQPSETAQAVRKLDGVWFDPACRNNYEPRIVQRICFKNWLAQRIEALALPEEAAKARAEAHGLPPSEFTMYLDPVMVINSEPISGSDRRRREIFLPAKQEPTRGERASFRRSTTVTLDLQLVAGELLADTLLKRPVPGTPPNSTSGRVEKGNAVPETTKAAGPGGHNGLLSEQPALARKRAQTAPVSKVKSVAQQRGKQTAFEPAACGSQVRYYSATAKDAPAWYVLD